MSRFKWDEWRGSLDGRPTLWVKHVWRWRGRLIDIHKMTGKDDPECFHTHPAVAIRIILWGGYVEEMEGGRHRMWLPGMIGLVRATCSHRIVGLRNGKASYSLWIRFRRTAPVHLRGEGWDKQARLYRAPNTIIQARPVKQ
jgi:hypothetical protein